MILYLYLFSCSFHNKVVIKYDTPLWYPAHRKGIFNQAPPSGGFIPQQVCEDAYNKSYTQGAIWKPSKIV